MKSRCGEYVEEELGGQVRVVCSLLESLLAAEPGLGRRLQGLLAQLSRYGPSLEVQAWLARMFHLSAAGSDTSLLTEVSSTVWKLPR